MSSYWAQDAVRPIPIPGGEPLLFTTPIASPAALACPICGSGNLHLSGAEGNITDASVAFTCEGGDHPFDLQFHFHKGSVYVSVVQTMAEAELLDQQIAEAEETLRVLLEARRYQRG